MSYNLRSNRTRRSNSLPPRQCNQAPCARQPVNMAAAAGAAGGAVAAAGAMVAAPPATEVAISAGVSIRSRSILTSGD